MGFINQQAPVLRGAPRSHEARVSSTRGASGEAGPGQGQPGDASDHRRACGHGLGAWPATGPLGPWPTIRRS